MHKKLNWKKKYVQIIITQQNSIMPLFLLTELIYSATFFFLILSPAAKIGSTDKFKKKITLN